MTKLSFLIAPFILSPNKGANYYATLAEGRLN